MPFPDITRNNGYTIVLQGQDDSYLPSQPQDSGQLMELQSTQSCRDDVEQVSSIQNDTGNSSMRMAFMNMANSILGAGIIGQPYAIRNTGLIAGIILMVFLSFLIDWTLRLIVINATLLQTNSYQNTVHHCFGNKGKAILLFFICSFAYGGSIAFCIIIGDTIPHVLIASFPSSLTSLDSAIGWLFKRNSIIVIFTTFVSYPLSLNRDISKLANASAFALVGMIIIVVMVVIRGPFSEAESPYPMKLSEWIIGPRIAKGVSVISFALVCHHNTLFIYNSMKNPSMEKFDRLTHIACFVSMVCCLIMGTDGFLTFGRNTKGNVLNNFKSTDNWINIARCCFGLNMLTTLPLEVFVVRDVVQCVIPNSENNNIMHFVSTTIIVFTAMGISLMTCNLGIILELIGATSASFMAYIIPPLCYLKCCWDQWDHKTRSKRDFIVSKSLPSISCVFFGFVIMIFSSYMSIKDSFNNMEASSCVV